MSADMKCGDGRGAGTAALCGASTGGKSGAGSAVEFRARLGMMRGVRRMHAGPLAATLAAAALLAVTLAAPPSASADEQSACAAAAGSYLTGVVVSAPKFARGQFRKGIELSHTHVSLRADQDGRVYDVAMDNVFANGYQKNSKRVPAPLSSIHVDDHLELCGQLYTSGVGIHWVHTNCGATPTATAPDGWVKQLGADGTPGVNDESNNKFCSIF
jgi:hypothetical protein